MTGRFIMEDGGKEGALSRAFFSPTINTSELSFRVEQSATRNLFILPLLLFKRKAYTKTDAVRQEFSDQDESTDTEWQEFSDQDESTDAER